MTSKSLPNLPSPWRDRTDRATRPFLPARPVTPVVRQAASFAAIGVVSTLAYVAVYAALRNVATAEVANTAALLITAIGNTAANRRLTFAVQGRDGLGRDHLAGLVAFAIALAITSASLGVLHLLDTSPGRSLELFVLIGANVAATAVRFVLLRVALGRRHTLADAVPERIANDCD